MNNKQNTELAKMATRANELYLISIDCDKQALEARMELGVHLTKTKAKCPHGTCFYCPGGPGSEFGDVPQSYTGNEPSTMRSIRNHYDPYLIIFNRLEQFVILHQNPEKTEIIIQGGTFLSLDKKYKQ